MNPLDLTTWPLDRLQQLKDQCEEQESNLIDSILEYEHNIKEALLNKDGSIDLLNGWDRQVKSDRSRLNNLAKTKAALTVAIEQKQKVL